LRTEIFKRMYEKPIHPKNMWITKEPLQHEEHDEIFRENIKRLQEMGVYTPPSRRFKGSQFIHPVKDRKMRAWEKMRDLFWGDKGLEE
nr:hypothetical protein [Deltaproteobacteria bacterium]